MGVGGQRHSPAVLTPYLPRYCPTMTEIGSERMAQLLLAPLCCAGQAVLSGLARTELRLRLYTSHEDSMKVTDQTTK